VIRYTCEPELVHKNLDRVFQHGVLEGTGRLCILPVDQGFEHGPVQAFGQNPDAMDPLYHFKFAQEVGVSALAAPMGFLMEGVQHYGDQIPLILKLNSNNLLMPAGIWEQAVTATVDDAVRLGCVGVGLTIYPGSPAAHSMIEMARATIARARENGLFSVVWCYPRGPEMKGKERAVDVLAYSVHMAALLGAHVIKVKLPDQGYALPGSAKSVVEVETLSQKVALIVRAAFEGRRHVIFSGNNLDSDQSVLDGIRAIIAGGGCGSIIGRNAFQRPWDDAVALMNKVLMLYKNE